MQQTQDIDLNDIARAKSLLSFTYRLKRAIVAVETASFEHEGRVENIERSALAVLAYETGFMSGWFSAGGPESLDRMKAVADARAAERIEAERQAEAAAAIRQPRKPKAAKTAIEPEAESEDLKELKEAEAERKAAKETAA